MKTDITVVGGRMDGGEENIKWIEDFPNMEEALEAAHNNSGYEILYIEITQGSVVWKFNYHDSIIR